MAPTVVEYKQCKEPQYSVVPFCAAPSNSSQSVPLQENRTPSTQTLTPSPALPTSSTRHTPSGARDGAGLGEGKPRVMFTGLIDKKGERTVKELGGEMVDSVYDCTHLITDKVSRSTSL